MKNGTLVTVWRDNGEVLITTTRSEVKNLHGQSVVWLNGISGCYAADRVRPVTGKNIHPTAIMPLGGAVAGEL